MTEGNPHPGDKEIVESDPADSIYKKGEALIYEMTQAAEALVKTLGLPPETKYDLLNVLYEEGPPAVEDSDELCPKDQQESDQTE